MLVVVRMRLAIVPFVLTACAVPANDVYVPPDLDQARVVIFDGPEYTPAKQDILIVVDRSPAMETRERTIRSGLAAGAAVLAPYDLDFHVGVISADLSDGGRLIHTSGVPDGYLVQRRLPSGGARTNFAGDLGDAISTLADVGHAGSPRARPFDAIELALAGNPYNSGFRRADARLLVILIVAGDDESVASPDVAATFLRARAPREALAVSVIRGDAAPRVDALAAQFAELGRSISLETGELETAFFGLDTLNNLFDGLTPCIDTVGPPYDCQVSDVTQRHEQVLPACGERLPCWEIVEAPRYCVPYSRFGLDVRREEYAPRGTHVIGQCVTR